MNYLAAALACICIRQAFRIARLNRTLRTVRSDYTDGVIEARLEVSELTIELAELKALTGSWTATLIEGGDA